MDDEEIQDLLYSLTAGELSLGKTSNVAKVMEKAAIRLYRMAEENTMAIGLKREGWTCKEDSIWNKEIEQARVDERARSSLRPADESAVRADERRKLIEKLTSQDINKIASIVFRDNMKSEVQNYDAIMALAIKAT